MVLSEEIGERLGAIARDRDLVLKVALLEDTQRQFFVARGPSTKKIALLMLAFSSQYYEMNRYACIGRRTHVTLGDLMLRPTLTLTAGKEKQA